MSAKHRKSCVRWRAVVAALTVALGACGKSQSKGVVVGVENVAAVEGSAAPARKDDGVERVPAEEQPPQSGVVWRVGEPHLSSADAITGLAVAGDLVLTCGYHHVRLWELSTGTLKWHTYVRQHRTACALSPNGRYVALAYDGRTALRSERRVIDWRRGKEAKEEGDAQGFAFSPDDERLVVLRWEMYLRAADNEKPVTSVGTSAQFAAFSADGSVVAVDDDKVMRWDPSSDAKRTTVIATLPARTRRASFDASGRRLAWVADRGFGIVELESGTVTPLTFAVGGKVVEVALSPDGTRLALSTESALSLWSVADGAKLWELKKLYRPPVAFSADGKTLYTANVSRVISVDVESGSVTSPPPRTEFVAWSSDGSAILRQGERTWAVDVRSRTQRETFEEPRVPQEAPAWVDMHAVTPDGGVIGVASEQLGECGALEVWVKGRGEHTLPKPGGCVPDQLDPTWLLPGSGLVVTNTSPVVVWDAVERKRLFGIPRGHRPLVNAAASGGVLLVAWGHLSPPPEEEERDYAGLDVLDGTRFEAWSLAEGRLLGSFRVDEEDVSALAISPNGEVGVVGWDGGALHRIDVRAMSGATPLGTHLSRIEELSFSPDGSLIAASDADASTTFWAAAP